MQDVIKIWNYFNDLILKLQPLNWSVSVSTNSIFGHLVNRHCSLAFGFMVFVFSTY